MPILSASTPRTHSTIPNISLTIRRRVGVRKSLQKRWRDIRGKEKGGLRRKNGGPEAVHPAVHIGIIGKSPFKNLIFSYGSKLTFVLPSKAWYNLGIVEFIYLSLVWCFEWFYEAVMLSVNHEDWVHEWFYRYLRLSGEEWRSDLWYNHRMIDKINRDNPLLYRWITTTGSPYWLVQYGN